jgi:hypothetical protein
MLIVNTASDLTATEAGAERTAFLTSLLNDYIAFDDAVYPVDYDKTLQPGDDGYVEPVVRQEWNAVAAAAWGFSNQAEIEAALSL